VELLAWRKMSGGFDCDSLSFFSVFPFEGISHHVTLFRQNV
jgi:hypothetical protein